MTTIHNVTLTKIAKLRTEREDNRSAKRYGLEVTFRGVAGAWDDWHKKLPESRTRELVKEAWKNHTVGMSFPKGWEQVHLTSSTGWSFHHKHSRDGGYANSVILHLYIKVQRPKFIPKEEEVLDLLGGEGALQSILWDATVQALTEAEEQKAAEAREREANHLLDALSMEIVRKAKDICRWKQRYEALVAEFEAEKQVQAGKMCEELAKEGITYKEGPADIRVVQAVARNLAKASENRGLPSRFSHSAPNLVTADDVR